MDKDFLDALEVIVGSDGLVCDAGELLTYETDGLVKLRSKPGVAVLPTSTLQVQAVVRLCHESNVPFVARGQGTGLSGGAMPHPDGVLIVLTRMNRILEIDLPNRCITVEPGVMNLDVTKAVTSDGYYYEDDKIREGIKEYSDWPTIPQLYLKGEFVGGCDIVKEMYESGELQKKLSEKNILN